MKLTKINSKHFAKISLEQKYQLAVQLGTIAGFHQYYFDSLPYYKTNTQTFNNANDLYYSIFKQYKFTDYDSFRRSLTYHLKQKK